MSDAAVGVAAEGNQCIDSSKVRQAIERTMVTIRNRPEYLNEPDAVMVLARTAVLGNKLLKFLPNEHQQLSPMAVCDYSQFLVDFSYAIELKLVNHDFHRDLLHLMDQIFELLDQALSVLLPLTTETDYLMKRKELLECVHWRRGALCYMYCHTAFNDKDTFLHTEVLKQKFLRLTQQGVKSLSVDFPSVRETETSADYQSSDGNTAELLRQGILSDTHMLALMYGAEMCYWTCQLTSSEFTGADFNPRQTGLQLSTKYLSLANGLLQDSNWKTQTANTIKSYFEKS